MVEVILGQPHKKEKDNTKYFFWCLWQASFLTKVAQRKSSPGTQKMGTVWTIRKSCLFPVFQRVKSLIVRKEGSKQLKIYILAVMKVPLLQHLLSYFCFPFTVSYFAHWKARTLAPKFAFDHEQIVKATSLFRLIKDVLLFRNCPRSSLTIQIEIKGIGQLYLLSWRLSFVLLVIPFLSNNLSEKVWDLASYPSLTAVLLCFFFFPFWWGVRGGAAERDERETTKVIWLEKEAGVVCAGLCVHGEMEKKKGKNHGPWIPNSYLVRILQDSRAALLIFITFHFPLISSEAVSNFIRSFSSNVDIFLLQGIP